jgi:hypothetical protein
VTNPPASSTDSPARSVALAYFDAWSSGNLDEAMTYVAPDVVCDAPAGRIEGARAYRAFMEPFVRMLVSARMIAAFGDADTALLMYDTQTTLVQGAPGAEYVTIELGLIRYSRFLFDRLPFHAARRAAT